MLLFITCLFLCVIFQDNALANIKATTLFKSHDKAFEIEYPTDWKVDSTGFMSSNAVFYNDKQDLFKESVNIIVQNSSSYTLKEYLELSKSQFKQWFPTFIELNNKVVKYNSNFYMLEYMYKVRTIEEEHNPANYYIMFPSIHYLSTIETLFEYMKGQFYLTIKDNKAYLITCTSLAYNYEKYREVFDFMIKSFRILD